MTLRKSARLLVLGIAAACGTPRAAPPRAAAGAGAPDSARAIAPGSGYRSSGDWCELADTGVEAAIAAVARARNADEYCEDRHYAVDDMDGDSLEDFAVTFELEPADTSADDEAYLMVFLSSRRGRRPLLLEIDNIGGDYGARYPTNVSSDGRYVVVDFENYRPDDPDCCPSGSSTVRFLVTDDRIVEQVPPRRRLPPGASGA